MGNDPAFIQVVRDNVKNGYPCTPTLVAALLQHIDSLEAQLALIEEDKNDE